MRGLTNSLSAPRRSGSEVAGPFRTSLPSVARERRSALVGSLSKRASDSRSPAGLRLPPLNGYHESRVWAVARYKIPFILRVDSEVT